jgi:hypothetical protein
MNYFARSAWIVAGCVAAVLSASLPVGAQEFEVWQTEEFRTLALAVGETRSESRAPDEGAIEYLPSFMQGAEGVVYVPFTLMIDPSVITTPNLAVFVALAAPDATPAPDAGPPAAIFENVFYREVSTEASGQIRISGALQSASGEYDVYIAVRDSFDGDAPIESSINPVTGQPVRAPIVPPITILRERVTIPNLWNGELALSTVFLNESVEMLSEEPAPEDLAKFPYTFGGARLVPRLDNRLTKSDTLAWVFQIYNPGHDNGMPDIAITYEFFTKDADGGETFFNRTEPVALSSEQLPPGFDVAMATLVDGQDIPLGGFPVGDYRLEIKVTDNERSAEVTRDLLFTVAE